MATIHNEIAIDASVEKIWGILTNLELLESYDTTVKKSTLVTKEKTGINAKRKVDMADGRNWFEEKVTEFEPGKALTFELTACSFPVERLKHSYRFERSGNLTKVKQTMDYTIKFGLFGKVLDSLMIRKQSDVGIKKFMNGLKSIAEKE
jgi:ribosome-associated toxin RatA of RatAB toxin-antitoxin module